MPFKFNFTDNIYIDSTPIKNVFIKDFLPASNPTFSIVYIYALNMVLSNNLDFTNKTLADSLNLLESDVVKAWKYWNEKGIVLYNAKTDMVEFLNLSEPVKKQDIKNSDNTENIFAKAESPYYAPEELRIYISKSQEVKNLFNTSQKYLGRLLSHKDMSTIFGFYDWLSLPMNVIEILFSYCSENNHRNLRYIEKVAVEWAEKGINTKERALEYLKTYNTEYRSIMRFFGQSMREPTPAEEDYMKKWLKAYNFSLEIIKSACEKAVLNTGKPSFPYADSILTNWNKYSVKTLEDIKELEEKFNQEKNAKANANTKIEKPSPKTNRFVNYEQREWNFDELEKLEKEYIKKDLEG